MVSFTSSCSTLLSTALVLSSLVADVCAVHFSGINGNTNKFALPPDTNPSMVSQRGPRRLTALTPPSPATGSNGAIGVGYFQQLLDHSNPSLGTFTQRYWYNEQYWNGPGAPVVLFTPGETDASAYTGYLSSSTLPGAFAQSINAAVIMIEHRYWGQSSPFTSLTVPNLQYLTVANAINDLTYFANNVVLPFDLKNSSQASNAPWVLTGGSYSGALSAWTAVAEPNTFWAYHASSAPVQATSDFWEYFSPVQQGMPKNCSNDLTAVIDYIDETLLNGTVSAVDNLKSLFGLQGLPNGDFGSAIANGPFLWQGQQFYTGYSDFFQFCDYIEGYGPGSVSSPNSGSAQGVGLQTALANYASYTAQQIVPGYCASMGYTNSETDISCLNMTNPSNPMYSDIGVSNSALRQWVWLLCNDGLDWWQTGAPQGQPSLLSRFITVEWYTAQCPLYFPGWTPSHKKRDAEPFVVEFRKWAEAGAPVPTTMSTAKTTAKSTSTVPSTTSKLTTTLKTSVKTTSTTLAKTTSSSSSSVKTTSHSSSTSIKTTSHSSSTSIKTTSHSSSTSVKTTSHSSSTTARTTFLAKATSMNVDDGKMPGYKVPSSPSTTSSFSSSLTKTTSKTSTSSILSTSSKPTSTTSSHPISSSSSKISSTSSTAAPKPTTSSLITSSKSSITSSSSTLKTSTTSKTSPTSQLPTTTSKVTISSTLRPSSSTTSKTSTIITTSTPTTSLSASKTTSITSTTSQTPVTSTKTQGVYRGNYVSGWNPPAVPRLMWSNGQFDPWRETGVSSDFRPGGPMQATSENPIQVIPGGVHCYDLNLANGYYNAQMMSIINNEISIMKGWVAQYYNNQTKV